MREAVISLDDGEFAELGIEELMTELEGVGIEDFDVLACHRDGAVVQVEVGSRPAEKRLRELSYVDRLERVSGGDTHLYIVGFTAPALAGEMEDAADELVGGCDAELTDQGARFSLVGPQEAIRKTVESYQSAGVSPDLRKLGEYEKGSGPLADLTDRQREVLETAYELGYYDVPRGATAEEIAGQFDLDDSTVAEHLQRAERTLLTDHLSASLS